jgi:hypothetical protein
MYSVPYRHIAYKITKQQGTATLERIMTVMRITNVRALVGLGTQQSKFATMDAATMILC